MQDQNLLFRNDTILGVCEAIGADFGFHANWLRLAFCAAFFVNPLIIAGAYVALAIPVALARWMFPNRSDALPVEQVEAAAGPQASEDQQPLPLAA